MQGGLCYYGISILIPKCNEIYTQDKDKIRGQKLVQICIISHCHMSDRPYMKHENFMQTDHWVTLALPLNPYSILIMVYNSN